MYISSYHHSETKNKIRISSPKYTWSLILELNYFWRVTLQFMYVSAMNDLWWLKKYFIRIQKNKKL